MEVQLSNLTTQVSQELFAYSFLLRSVHALIKLTNSSFFSVVRACEDFLPRLLFSHSCGHKERMGVCKLFDSSTFLPQSFNGLFIRAANLLRKRNVPLYTKMPSSVAEGLYITGKATKSQAKCDDYKWTVHHSEALWLIQYIQTVVLDARFWRTLEAQSLHGKRS